MSVEHSHTPHTPVLLEATLEGLNVEAVAAQPGGHFIDGTVGAGGHAAAILSLAPNANLLGLDRDPRSLDVARDRLADFGARAILIHASYEAMAHVGPLHGFQPGEVDGVLLDLGLSSMHVDEPARGFAFRHDGPLDMRFDPSAGGPTAADLVNSLGADALADVLFRYGEEKDSRRIARAIVAARPLHTTGALAQVIASASRPARDGRQGIHPATRTFQALRIAVNDELGILERSLPTAVAMLRPGGRLVVISFHSLEDRIVKDYFRTEATDCLCPPHQPICTCGHKASLRLISRKPISADETEIAANPRSRSARLRVAERLA
jgi:16S rRNA (cytosine1402-N4)-methyltransferase